MYTATSACNDVALPLPPTQTLKFLVCVHAPPCLPFTIQTQNLQIIIIHTLRFTTLLLTIVNRLVTTRTAQVGLCEQLIQREMMYGTTGNYHLKGFSSFESIL